MPVITAGALALPVKAGRVRPLASTMRTSICVVCGAKEHSRSTIDVSFDEVVSAEHCTEQKVKDLSKEGCSFTNSCENNIVLLHKKLGRVMNYTGVTGASVNKH